MRACRSCLLLGPGVRIVDFQRQTEDVYFLPTTTERTRTTSTDLRVQPYLSLGVRGSVDVADGVRLGLDVQIDPAVADLRLYETYETVEVVDNGSYTRSWDHKADVSAPIPRAGVFLAVSL